MVLRTVSEMQSTYPQYIRDKVVPDPIEEKVYALDDFKSKSPLLNLLSPTTKIAPYYYNKLLTPRKKRVKHTES